MNALDIKVDGPYGKKITLRNYFRELLLVLWHEGDGFSGKRPFGDSGWEYDIYAALIKHKFIDGTLDEDGYVDDFDAKAASAFVSDLIEEIFKK